MVKKLILQQKGVFGTLWVSVFYYGLKSTNALWMNAVDRSCVRMYVCVYVCMLPTTWPLPSHLEVQQKRPIIQVPDLKKKNIGINLYE